MSEEIAAALLMAIEHLSDMAVKISQLCYLMEERQR